MITRDDLLEYIERLSPQVLHRARRFYQQSPDGQYDEVVVDILTQLIDYKSGTKLL